MNRTIEAIMRHMVPPASRLTNQNNSVEKLEKEIAVEKRPSIRAHQQPRHAVSI